MPRIHIYVHEHIRQPGSMRASESIKIIVGTRHEKRKSEEAREIENRKIERVREHEKGCSSRRFVRERRNVAIIHINFLTREVRSGFAAATMYRVIGGNPANRSHRPVISGPGGVYTFRTNESLHTRVIENVGRRGGEKE